MIKKTSFVLILAFLLFAGIPKSSASGPANVSASVTVTCPFKITLNVSPAYMRYGNITMQYTLQSITDCFIQDMQGSFEILNTTGAVLWRKSLLANYTNLTPRTYNVSIKAASLANGTYYAYVKFANMYTQASNTSKFELLNPANIVITRFYGSGSTVPLNSPFYVFVNITNTGQLTSNPIQLNISISGPVPFSGTYTLSKLMPHAYENISIYIPNVTTQHGNFTAHAVAYYSTKAPNANVIAYNISNKMSFIFYVLPGRPIKPTPIPITPTPLVSLTSAPLLVAVPAGVPVISQLSFSDISTAPETVNISISKEFANIVRLSASTLELLPGQVLTAQVAFTPLSNTTPGTYIIPINITATIANKSTSTTEFATLVVSKPTSAAELSTQTLLINNTNQASGTLAIKAPANTSLSNFTVEARIPASAVKNISDIYAYGLPSNITEQDGYYVIDYYVTYLPKGQETYAYYTLNKPNQAFLRFAQNLLMMPSKPAPAQALRILSISTPTLYANSSTNMTVSALYTGTVAGQVYFAITAPPGVSVTPASIVQNASTNQLLFANFRLTSTGSPGTYMLSLYAAYAGYNTTYSIPLIVLPKPVSITTSTIAYKPISPVVPAYAAYASLTAIVLILIIVAIIEVRKKKPKPQYRQEVVEHLARIREQIKRE